MSYDVSYIKYQFYQFNMVLYIFLMPFIESVPGVECPAVGANVPRSLVSGVNAHLRLIPRDPNDFRVVVTFHHTDGSLCEVVTFHRADGSPCEAELKPVEAAGLMSEIWHVIDQGNDQGRRTAAGQRHGARDD
jgi:hypothetical protein